MKIAFATSCDLNYLAQAHTLALSVKDLYPTSTFFLGLNESTSDFSSAIKDLSPIFDHVLAGIELHPLYSDLAKRYGVVELCCSTKPELLKSCFKAGNDYVIYLDPDTFLLKQMDEVFEFLSIEGNEAIFTPHLTILGNVEMEVSAMKHGVLNLGFLGLKRSTRVDEFLNWWSERLETMCIADPHRGIFTDQSWAGLAIGTLNSKVIQNPGYNFATWNLADHEVKKNNGEIYVDSSPLVFAHFSGFGADGIAKFIEKFKVPISRDYLELLENYRDKVLESSKLLAKVIARNTIKVHYKKRRFYDKTARENKVRFIDYLYINYPRVLKLLVWVKDKIK